MAEDCLAVMRALGHNTLYQIGGPHDQAERVAYRLGSLDHPEEEYSARLIPSRHPADGRVWRRMTAERAFSGYHWQFWRSRIRLPRR
jgi:hypothetical protein